MQQLEQWLDRYPKSVSLALGAVAALGFPPLKLWPLALLAMGLLVVLLSRSSDWKSALLRGWLFGIAHFTVTNCWIATAFTHQAEMPAFLGWLAVPLLSLYLAVYPALAAAGARLVAGETNRPLTFTLAFGALWIVTEWLRAWVFTGYAWGPFSLALLGPDSTPGLAAVLPWFGSYALSGVAVLLAAGLVWSLLSQRWFVAAVLLLSALAGMNWPAGEGAQGTQRFVVVQPDLDQQELNDPSQYEAAFVTLTSLSKRRDGETEKRLVFWPESGLPDYLRDGYPKRYYGITAGGDPAYARRRIGRAMGEETVLLTGAVDLEIRNDKAAWAYNVVSALDENGDFVGSYSKAHLVPYGEYLPLRSFLEPLGLSRLVAGSIDFHEGPGPRTLQLGDYGRAGIQICYEIVFSGQVADPDDRPEFLFNPSNDGWFGAWGPPQHFAQARMRAIEEGLPVIRSTTTGISGVIDARGVVRQSLGQSVEGRIDGFIPPAREPTLFARGGNVLGLGWAGLLLVLAWVVRSPVGGSPVAMRWRQR